MYITSGSTPISFDGCVEDASSKPQKTHPFPMAPSTEFGRGSSFLLLDDPYKQFFPWLPLGEPLASFHFSFPIAPGPETGTQTNICGSETPLRLGCHRPGMWPLPRGVAKKLGLGHQKASATQPMNAWVSFWGSSLTKVKRVPSLTEFERTPTLIGKEKRKYATGDLGWKKQRGETMGVSTQIGMRGPLFRTVGPTSMDAKKRACLLACTLTCLPACLLICLPACLLACACLCLPVLACACLCLPVLACACLCLPVLACACLCLPALACACLCLPACRLAWLACACWCLLVQNWQRW